ENLCGHIKRHPATYGYSDARTLPNAATWMSTSVRLQWSSKDREENLRSERDRRADGFTPSIQKTASFCGKQKWVKAASLAASNSAMLLMANECTRQYRRFRIARALAALRR